MKFLVLSVVLSAYISCTTSKSFPHYIEKCSISKNFDECFVKHGNLAIPKLLNGDPDLKIPSFNPLIINEVVFSPGDSLKVVLTKVKVSGFENTKVLNAHYDKSEQSIAFTVQIPKLEVVSEYTAKGKILVLPFEGEGPCQITLINMKPTIKIIIDNFEPESKENVKLKSTEVEYKVDKSTYHFENLFNGNKQLGDDLNKFLNENHADLAKDFEPVFTNIIQAIVENLINQTIGQLVYKEVLLP